MLVCPRRCSRMPAIGRQTPLPPVKADLGPQSVMPSGMLPGDSDPFAQAGSPCPFMILPDQPGQEAADREARPSRRAAAKGSGFSFACSRGTPAGPILGPRPLQAARPFPFTCRLRRRLTPVPARPRHAGKGLAGGGQRLGHGGNSMATFSLPGRCARISHPDERTSLWRPRRPSKTRSMPA